MQNKFSRTALLLVALLFFLGLSSHEINAEQIVLSEASFTVNIGSSPSGTDYFNLSNYPEITNPYAINISSLVHFNVEDGGNWYVSNGCGEKTFNVGNSFSCTAQSDDGGRPNYHTMNIKKSWYDSSEKRVYVEYSWDTTRNLGGTWWITLKESNVSVVEPSPPPLKLNLGTDAGGSATSGEGDKTTTTTEVPFGRSTTMRWSAENASSCFASGDWGGSKPTSGDASTGAITESKTFELTCSDSSGNNATRVINVNPPTNFSLFILDGENIDVKVSALPTSRSETIHIGVNPLSGFSSDVSLSLVAPPENVESYEFSPQILGSSQYASGSEFFVTVSREIDDGSHVLTVLGTGDGLTNTLNINLEVDNSLPDFGEF